ncbi:MAG: hypothetical protein ABIL23_07900 [candidate division WOR-3 bacterium]
MRKVIILVLILAACVRASKKKENFEFKLPESANVGLDSLFKGKGVFVDPINGYYIRHHKGWTFQTVGGIFYAYNDKGYSGMVAFARGSIDEVFNSLKRDLSPYVLNGTEVMYKEGKENERAIYLRKILFPSKFAINEGKGEYDAIFVLIGGKEYTRVSAMLYPSKYDTLYLNELKEIVGSFHILPPSYRIPFTVDSILDPSGIVAMYSLVPEGYNFNGSVIKLGTAWGVSYSLVGDTTGEFLRLDGFNFKSSYVGSPMGYSAFTVYNLNGKVWRAEGFLSVESQKTCQDLIINLIWDKGWNVEDIDYQRLKAPPSMVPGGKSMAYKIYIKAVKGDTLRYGLGFCSLAGFVNTDMFGISNGYGGGSIFVFTFQMPEKRHVEFSRIAISFLNSNFYNPQWLEITNQRFIAENKRLNALTMNIIEERRREAQAFQNYLSSIREESESWREIISEGNEFVSDMNTAWTNALGEHVFTKDPETGEIFRLDDHGGDFYRERDFGNIIEAPYGDYDVQKNLEEMGWKKMERSFWEFK